MDEQFDNQHQLTNLCSMPECVLGTQIKLLLIDYNKLVMSKAAQAYPSETAKQQAKHDKPKIFERFWAMLFLVVSIFMLVLSNKIYLFHTMPEFKSTKKGSLFDLLKFSIPFAVAYILVDYIIHSVMDAWVEKNYLRRDKYIDTVSRQKKSRVIVRWGFNIFYYSLTSAFAYALLKETSFLPPVLGGHGDVYSLLDHRYLDEATFGMEVFYYIQFGKHVGRYFCHVFIQPEGSFYEYLLHHSLSAFLIFFSYSLDMWVIGIFVLFCHDFSDVFLAFARMYRERNYRHPAMSLISYGLTIISWIGFRILSFGYCCVFAGWYQYFAQIHVLTPVQDYVFRLPYMFMAFMISCLLLMHIYWIYYIFESFISSNVSQKIASHSYD